MPSMVFSTVFNRGTIFNKLTTLYPTHACKELNDVFPELMKECDYRYVKEFSDLDRTSDLPVTVYIELGENKQT